jgi:putative ABC transport system ATP-binding protein
LLGTGVPVNDAQLQAREALARVGLEQFAGHLVEELSGGQQQCVAVARSLAMRAGLVLADEPTSDLDAANRQRVIQALRDEADAGATVIMATHDAESAAQLDAELRLDDGLMSWHRPPTTGWDQHM